MLVNAPEASQLNIVKDGVKLNPVEAVGTFAEICTLWESGSKTLTILRVSALRFAIALAAVYAAGSSPAVLDIWAGT